MPRELRAAASNAMPLDSATMIERLVTTLLRDAEVGGCFPTPLDVLLHHRNLRLVRGSDPLAIFSSESLSLVPMALRRQIMPLRRQTLAVLDRSARVIHLRGPSARGRNDAQATRMLQERFVIAHEIGHDIIPWHQDALYLDGRTQLLPQTRALFEREANYCAAALLLQSPLHGRAISRALSTGGVTALWRLANLRGVSRHATLWHAVERYRGVALALELDNRVLGGAGFPYRFRLRARYASPQAMRLFPDLAKASAGQRTILSTEHIPALAQAWEVFRGGGAPGQQLWVLRDCEGNDHTMRIQFGANHYAVFLIVAG